MSMLFVVLWFLFKGRGKRGGEGGAGKKKNARRRPLRGVRQEQSVQVLFLPSADRQGRASRRPARAHGPVRRPGPALVPRPVPPETRQRAAAPPLLPPPHSP